VHFLLECPALEEERPWMISFIQGLELPVPGSQQEGFPPEPEAPTDAQLGVAKAPAKPHLETWPSLSLGVAG
jgi:hypothetical protein